MAQTDQETTYLHTSHVLPRIHNPLMGSCFTLSSDGLVRLHCYLLMIPPFSAPVGLLLPERIEDPFEFFCYTAKTAGVEACKLRFLSSEALEKESLNTIYTFNFYLLSDMYLLNQQEMNASYIKFEDLFVTNPGRVCCLIIPLLENHCIDWETIKMLIWNRESVPKGISILQPGQIAQSRHKCRKTMSVICTIQNPAAFTLEHFVKLMVEELTSPDEWGKQRLTTEEAWSKIMVALEFRDYENEKSQDFFGYFLQSHITFALKGKFCITNMTSIEQNLAKNIPMIFLHDLLKPLSFSHTNKEKLFPVSCKRRLQKPFPRVYFANDVDFYPIQCPLLDTFMRVPSVLNMMFTFYPIKLFQKAHKIPMKDSLLFLRCFCTKKFDFQYNLESLETLGDVVLKSIQVLAMYLLFEDANEGQMTELKNEWISNSFYSEIGCRLGLPFLIKNEIQTIPNVSIFKEKIIHKMEDVTRKNVSDCFEALIGGLFLQHPTLTSIYSLLVNKTDILSFTFADLNTNRCYKCHPQRANNPQNNRRGEQRNVCFFCFKTPTNPESGSIWSFDDPSSSNPTHHDSFERWLSLSPEKKRIFRSLVDFPHYHFDFEVFFPELSSISLLSELTKLQVPPLSAIDNINLIHSFLDYTFQDPTILATVFDFDRVHGIGAVDFNRAGPLFT